MSESIHTIPGRIELAPPLNNICRIELLSHDRALLTLRNGGTLCIAIRDAARYGIAHILKEGS